MTPRIENAKIAGLVESSKAGTRPAVAGGGTDFAAILQDRLKVSGHAQTRLQSRGISLSEGAWNRVMSGVQMAASKGARESLVMVDNVALVVSVKNRTVITAVDQSNLKDNVFTNIDSAIIV